jgi:hypothetical protein
MPPPPDAYPKSGNCLVNLALHREGRLCRKQNYDRPILQLSLICLLFVKRLVQLFILTTTGTRHKLKVQVFWDVILCLWVFMDVPKENRAFETSGNIHKTTLCHIPEDLNL